MGFSKSSQLYIYTTCHVFPKKLPYRRNNPQNIDFYIHRRGNLKIIHEEPLWRGNNAMDISP
jgi:hypothetical protein